MISPGLFWDAETPPPRRHVPLVMPPIPRHNWRKPSLPDLSAARCLSFDVEGYDPDLLEMGPGWARGRGHLVGLAVGTDDGHRFYFPFGHSVLPEQNLDKGAVLEWARVNLGRKRQPKVGANLIYDVGWLAQEGVEVVGDLYDVQFAEALLTEGQSVSLDALGQRYLEEGKTGGDLYAWLAAYYGGAADGSQRANIHRAPPCLVAPYASGDVDLPLRVIEKQWPLLERAGLLELFKMEGALIPLIVAMRFAGVPVDVKGAEVVRQKLLAKEKEVQAQLRHVVGHEVNVDAAESLAQAFKTLGLPYNHTAPTARKPQGNPSFTKDFLATVQHPVGGLISGVRRVRKARTTFVEGYVLEANVDGVVYPQFHPLRGDENGTRSGRWSSSDPNYQNLPARDEEIGAWIRGLVLPDKRLGHTRWRKWDYSQIEYRFLAHYAVGGGADELRDIFCTDPEADYHEIVRQLIHRVARMLLDRKPTKTVNFGFIYGMGEDKLAKSLGLTPEKAGELFEAYHAGAPYVRETMDATAKEVEQTGTVRTILGRISRFDLWVPKRYDEDAVALPYAAAVREYGSVRRAYTHKALNRKLQGSAADLMKAAMLKCWKDGVFAETGVPRLTVHDELDFSDFAERNPAFDEMENILTSVLPLRVPIRADASEGPNWGACT